MRIFNLIFFAFVVMIFFQSCLGESYHKELNGNYYLHATNTREDMGLGYQDGEYGIGVIEATVFAIGQDESFIVVKQHPRDFPEKPNKAIVIYYIIPLKNKITKSIEKNFYGPLNLSEFEQKKNELNMKEISFTDIFKDLE